MIFIDRSIKANITKSNQRYRTNQKNIKALKSKEKKARSLLERLDGELRGYFLVDPTYFELRYVRLNFDNPHLIVIPSRSLSDIQQQCRQLLHFSASS
jgi:hypothetical protein